MTAQDLVNGTLKDIGVLAAGETPNADESADSLEKLNELIESFSVQRPFLTAVARNTYAFSIGVGSYTLGAGGTLTATRPVAVRQANTILTAGGLVQPIRLVSVEEFSAVLERSAQANFPKLGYYDGKYPLATLMVTPIPNAASTLELFTWDVVSQLASLATTIAMPPGYLQALRTTLAVNLATMFGRPVTQEMLKNAEEAKAALRGFNAPPYPGAAEEIQGAGTATPVPPDVAASVPR